MCSPVEDERSGHMTQEKVIPRVYSTGRGPALIQYLLLPIPGTGFRVSRRVELAV